MRLLLWIFSGRLRYAPEVRRYNNGRVGRRIWLACLSLICLAVMSGAQYWFTWILKTDAVTIAKVAVGILCFSTFLMTIDRCLVFCWIAFTKAFFSTVQETVNDTAKYIASEIGQSENLDEQFYLKTYKNWDVFLCLAQMFLAVATIAITCYTLVIIL